MTNTRIFTLFGCWIILLFSMSDTFAQEKSKLKLEQFFDVISVADPQLSPDGKEIIYTRGWVDKVNDSRRNELFIMNADGSKNRFFTKGSSPAWSPDGARIAYMSSGEPSGSQIFIKYKDSEGATQITRIEKTPSNMKWSPDGKFIAFNMLVPYNEPWNIKMPERPKGAKWTDGPKVITQMNYKRDRVGYLEEGFTHIFIVSAEGGTPRQITQGNWNHSGVEWTPDGKEILFTSLRVEEAEYEYRQSNVYAVNVETTAIRQLTDRNGIDRSPMVSPDGKKVAYVGYDWTDDTYIENKLYIMDIDGKNSKELAADFDRSPASMFWATDNSGVYFNADYNGTKNLYFAPIRGGHKQVSQGNHLLTVSDINKNGTAVGIMTDYHTPAEVITFNVTNPSLKNLTSLNESMLKNVQLGELEELWYKSTDDFDVHGWIVKPADFDPTKKYPMILVIHGGPHGMYNVGFNFTWQHHAAEGYVVLYTNPRGSSGYGSVFGNAIKNDYPGKDYDDLMNGVDEVIKKGFIDEKNLFVYGGSGGGVLTSWIVGHTDRFAAASVNFPVINWLSFVGNTDGVSWYKNFKEYPWDDPSEHIRRSPLMYVGNVKTPTMLMCGEDDLRTPISQTEEFYQALKVLKVPTAMIRFQNEYHGTGTNPSNYMRTQLYLYSWFDKYKRK
ncbi:S9 family peptidase [Mongoliitalea daihaiensis]|uniref:S9 family peptidase n=1 Tax=Mongoliitalea daihaiensis TaxID=2782006 RepID=UPI001F190FA1|nr:S9 family peptidase [Mongoliitalea daihaiensis]UJP63641.1 S9 family peptidase [Mongoliitalea daihaiensis]